MASQHPLNTNFEIMKVQNDTHIPFGEPKYSTQSPGLLGDRKHPIGYKVNLQNI